MKKAKPVLSLILFTLSSLLAAQSLTITAPNGGETLTLGQTVQITWTANGVNQKVKLQLIRGGGALVGLIEGNLNATPSSFTWTIGQTDSGIATADTNYKIRIRTADNALEDASNGTFTIAVASTPPPTSASPYKVYQPELQKKPLTVNAQIVPYAVIISFKVNGQDNSGGSKAECSRSQGIPCQASVFSKDKPILFRYTLRLDDPRNGLRHQILQTPWLQQETYTFAISQTEVMNTVFGDDPPSNVPLTLFGGVLLDVKNQIQSEPPKSCNIEIKMYL
jgi:hypothetical protein